MREKILKILFALVALGISCSLFFLPIYADEQGEDSGKMPEEYADFIATLPNDVVDWLDEGALSDEREKVSSAALEISSPDNIINLLIDALSSKISDCIPTLVLLLGIVIISAVIYTLSSSFGGGLGDGISLCARLCIYAVISGVALSSVSSIKEYFSSLFAAVSAFLPLSATLYAMGGNLTLAATSSASLSVILAVCQFFCTYTVVPVFCTCLALTLLSAFDGVFSFAGGTVCGSIKKWYNLALGLIMTLLTTSLGAQTIIASRADGVVMKGAKLVVGSFVPISGGAVSSTLGTLASSIALLRGTVGVIGIVALLLMLVPTIVELALMRVVFGLAELCAGMLSATGEQKILADIGSLYGYLEGVAVLCSVIFIIAFAIFGSVASPI